MALADLNTTREVLAESRGWQSGAPIVGPDNNYSGQMSSSDCASGVLQKCRVC